MKIYGPYIRKQDGRKIVILYDGKKRSARLYAKYLLEKYLNRKLLKGEEVDHIDGDITNDSIGNLRAISGTLNRVLANLRKYGSKETTSCLYCKKHISFSKSRKRQFCSNSCKSKHLGANQYGNKIYGYKRRVVERNTHET